MTSKASGAGQRKPRVVDCDKCRHFTGRDGFARVEWGCAKGHAAESTIILRRYGGCADHAAADRAEVIFRRFRSSAEFRGDEALKNHQALARRTASNLANSLGEFGELMDEDQVKAAREAVSALNRLPLDIERAAGLAKAYKVRRDAEREAERRRKGDELAARLLDGLSEADIIECAQHLAAFDTSEANRWLEARRGASTLTESGLWSPNDLAQRLKRASPALHAEVYAELRRDLAEKLQTLERHRSGYATRADFDAYRQLLRDRVAAKTSVASVLAVATVAARSADGGQP